MLKGSYWHNNFIDSANLNSDKSGKPVFDMTDNERSPSPERRLVIVVFGEPVNVAVGDGRW